MQQITSVSKLPNSPAVYAMYGGQGAARYVAYVGIATKLKARAIQHLVRRDSSVKTGTSAVVLNTDYITALRWWECPAFTDPDALKAGELIAFDVFEPVLRSRGAVSRQAMLLQEDGEFREQMAQLFSGEPSGQLTILTLQHAIDRISELEHRIVQLEHRLTSTS